MKHSENVAFDLPQETIFSTYGSADKCRTCGSVYLNVVRGGPSYHMSSPTKICFEIEQGSGCATCKSVWTEMQSSDAEYDFLSSVEATLEPLEELFLDVNALERLAGSQHI